MKKNIFGALVFVSTCLFSSSQSAAEEVKQTGPAAGENVIELQNFEVSARRETFENSIDRKVYNVGKDISSTTGSTTDLLQNIPSVQVDIDGNVSLRGDESVLILIDGKPSSLMGKDRAAVLEQMPADSIEKIEVITNPSAKYKPDGTAGIINITLKRNRTSGHSSSLRASVGNDGRYNAGLNASYTAGKFTLFGNLSVRRDDRSRTEEMVRSHYDPDTDTVVSGSQNSSDNAKPLSRIVYAGVDYRLNEQNELGASFKYNQRKFVRHVTEVNRTTDGSGAVTEDYDRLRVDPETDENVEFSLRARHNFPGDGERLDTELQHERSDEEENNSYTNIFRVPAQPPEFEHVILQNREENTRLTVEYVRPVGVAKAELGYAGETTETGINFIGSRLDSGTGEWVPDVARSNYFVHQADIHAVYASFGRPVGAFGFLAGLRFEDTRNKLDQRTTGEVDRNSYRRLYPTLHLTYDLTARHQLQLNYSRRVHRPDSEDLNPFPEYKDPTDLERGNPNLKPEDIHSFEAGYQFKDGGTTYLAALYYRYLKNGFTEVKRFIDSTTLLTTEENLATSRSAGLELGASRRFADAVSVNLSSNIFRNEIDASNLGFSAQRSAVAWEAKASAAWNATKALQFQFDANYRAKRLTPQGEREPMWVASAGLRYDYSKATSFIFTVSDIFDSLEQKTVLDTPELHETEIKRRSSTVFYIGFVHHFGSRAKKSHDEIEFDDAL